jgi:hypothetical protein
MRVRGGHRRFRGHARVTDQVSTGERVESIAPRDVGGRTHILVKIDGVAHGEHRDRGRVPRDPVAHPVRVLRTGEHRVIAVDGDR